METPPNRDASEERMGVCVPKLVQNTSTLKRKYDPDYRGEEDVYSRVDFVQLFYICQHEQQRGENQRLIIKQVTQRAGSFERINIQKRNLCYRQAGGGDHCDRCRAKSEKHVADIFVVAEFFEYLRNNDDNYQRRKDQPQRSDDAAQDSATDTVMQLAAGISHIGRAVNADRSGSRLGYGDHIGELCVGEPSSSVG